MSSIFGNSEELNIVTGAPPFTSRLNILSPEESLRTYPYLFPSGDQPRQQIASSSPTARNFRGSSPLGPMSQASRSPRFPLFVANEIVDPSGEIELTKA